MTLPTNADAGRTNFRTSVINLDRPGNPSVFSDQVRTEAAELISRYPVGQARSALLPLLHLVQSEQGYVTPDGIAFCADTLGLTKAQVAAVVTFYTMYKRSPTGEYLVSVCTNTMCGMLGGDEIFAALKDQLKVGNNETTPDGTITLEHAECLAACDYAPVVTVNYEFFDNQTVGTARNIVSQLQSGERPVPTRGAPLCTFKQIERQIAGLHDEAAYALEAGGSGVPTEVGVKLAIERGESAPSYAIDRTPEATQTAATQTAATEAPADGKAAAKPADANAARAKRSGAKPAKDKPAKDKPAKDKAADDALFATDEPAKKRAPRRSRSRRDRSAASNEGASANDAPLPTAESDPDHPTDTETEKGD